MFVHNMKKTLPSVEVPVLMVHLDKKYLNINKLKIIQLSLMTRNGRVTRHHCPNTNITWNRNTYHDIRCKPWVWLMFMWCNVICNSHHETLQWSQRRAMGQATYNVYIHSWHHKDTTIRYTRLNEKYQYVNHISNKTADPISAVSTWIIS
jgi:hypothetical protein